MASWWPSLSDAAPPKFQKELNSLIVLVARELWLEWNARIFDKVASMPRERELCRRINADSISGEELKLCGSNSTRGG
jgi:hypothetical protein